MGTNTTNLGLYKPTIDEEDWGALRNSSYDTLDTALGTQHTAAGNHIFVEVEDVTGYIKFPELTTIQRDALPSTVGMTIYNTSDGELQTYQAGSWQSVVNVDASVFADDVFRVQDNGDATKQIALEASGITTLTTRTITMPDTDVDLGDIAANTSKVTNQTHTTDVTGSVALTIDPVAITNKPAATVASGDLVMVADIDAANALKQVTAQSIGDLGGGGGAIGVDDEGSALTATLSNLDFVGAGVTATNVGSAVTVTVPGGGGSALEVEDEGVSLSTAVTKFNFVGAGVTVTEPVADQMLVTIPTTGSAATYTESFVDADLTAGVIAITHNLNDLYPLVQVYDNSENLILPDEVTSTSVNITTIDLTGYGTLVGTYNVVISASASSTTNPSFVQSFVDGDLTAGVLTVTHSLAQQYVQVQVFNNSDLMVIPTNVTLTDANNTDVDLTGFGALTGTWNVVVISAGGSVSSTATDLSLAGQVAEDYSTFDGTNWVTRGGSELRKVDTFTRSQSTATSTQAISGVGFKPSYIQIMATDNNGPGEMSLGYVDGDLTNHVMFDNNQNTGNSYNTSGGDCVYVDEGGGNRYTGIVTSFDADGFTISWTRVGVPTSTMTIYFTAFR